MPNSEIEEFAKKLVQHVRDAAIHSSDRILLQPNVTAPIARRWREAAERGGPKEFAKIAIPDIVDEALFYILHAIDDGLLKLSYSAANGKVVDLNTEGLSELAGWFKGSGGWVSKYSNERFADDVSDLEDFFRPKDG